MIAERAIHVLAWAICLAAAIIAVTASQVHRGRLEADATRGREWGASIATLLPSLGGMTVTAFAVAWVLVLPPAAVMLGSWAAAIAAGLALPRLGAGALARLRWPAAGCALLALGAAAFVQIRLVDAQDRLREACYGARPASISAAACLAHAERHFALLNAMRGLPTAPVSPTP